MNMENTYKTLVEFLNTIPAPDAGLEARTRWIADFNAVAGEIEQSVEHDANLPEVQDQVSLPPWLAQLQADGSLWLFTPPLVIGKTAVRLMVNADSPFTGTHVNSRVIDCDEHGMPVGLPRHVCLVTTNPEAGGCTLEGTWMLWDTIARLGSKRAMELGMVTEGWVNNVIRGAGACAFTKIYPVRLYARCGPANAALVNLYTLCESRGIDQDALHGEGRRDAHGRYYNSWFNGNQCTACDCSIRPPSRRWPNSYLGHVKTIKHRRNAGIMLLKQFGQGGNGQ